MLCYRRFVTDHGKIWYPVTAYRFLLKRQALPRNAIKPLKISTKEEGRGTLEISTLESIV